IAHTLESIPIIDKALEAWGNDMLKGEDSPEVVERDLAELRQVGVFWRRYGSDYHVIADLYTNGDSVIKARVKQLVPDVEQLVRVHRSLEKLQACASMPTSAYVTFAARYLSTLNMMEAGRWQEAVKTLIGVKNADPKNHLMRLDVMEKIYALRGDSPNAIK